MSNSIWDWWFGDGPQQHPVPSHSAHMHASRDRQGRGRVVRFLSWASGIATRRRFFVFLGVIGTSSTPVTGWAIGEEGKHNVTISPASFGWAPPVSFTMIEADTDVQADVRETLAAAPNAADEAEQKADNDAVDEDEQRQDRLRDLLGEDAAMSLKSDDEKDSKIKDEANAGDKDGTNEFDKGTSRYSDGDDEKSVFPEPFIEERLPDIEGGRFVLPPIRAVSIDQKPIGNGRVPEALNAGDELPLVALPEDGYSRLVLSGGGAWPQLIRPWAAPNTYSHPLYFEDRMLERHGHERWGCFQPLAAGTRFFATLPMMPYLATIQEPCDIVYSKGYYRAGSPVPKFYQRPPRERRAIVVQAAAVSGAFIALP